MTKEIKSELEYQTRTYPLEQHSILDSIFDIVGRTTAQMIKDRKNNYSKKDYGILSVSISKYMRMLTKRYYSKEISYYDIYDSEARAYFLRCLQR